MTLRRRDRLDTALAGTLVIGVIGTLVGRAIPSFHRHVVAPAADLAFDVIALAGTAAPQLKVGSNPHEGTLVVVTVPGGADRAVEGAAK